MRYPIDVLEEWLWSGHSFRLALWPSGRLTVQYYDAEDGGWRRAWHQAKHLVKFNKRTESWVSFHNGVYN